MQNLVDCRRMVERGLATHKPKAKKVAKEEKSALRISADMLVADIQALCPGSEPILAAWGLHCFGCSGSALETLGEGARGHGFSDSDVAELVDDLNAALEAEPPRPKELTITESAAQQLFAIAVAEGREKEALRVTLDGQGGFCLEFEAKDASADPTFGNATVPELLVRASALTLVRLGGSSIDWRDERFKLDLAEKEGCKCTSDTKTCGCQK